MPFRTHCFCHLRKPGLNTPVFRERIFYLRNWTTPGFLKEEHNRRLNLRVELNKRLSFLFGVVLNTSRAKGQADFVPIVSCLIPRFRFSPTLRAAQVADGIPTEIGMIISNKKII